jgi:hypothetical protein
MGISDGSAVFSFKTKEHTLADLSVEGAVQDEKRSGYNVGPAQTGFRSGSGLSPGQAHLQR